MSMVGPRTGDIACDSEFGAGPYSCAVAGVTDVADVGSGRAARSPVPWVVTAISSPD